MVRVAEGTMDGVAVAVTVAGGGAGEVVAGAQLPTKKARMKNAMMCFVILSLSFVRSIALL